MLLDKSENSGTKVAAASSSLTPYPSFCSQLVLTTTRVTKTARVGSTGEKTLAMSAHAYLAKLCARQWNVKRNAPILFTSLTIAVRLAVSHEITVRQCSLWRGGGLVVSALDFRSRGRGFEPGLCPRVVSSDKKLYFTLSLFTQV